MTGKRFLKLVLANRCAILLSLQGEFPESVETIRSHPECSKGSTNLEFQNSVNSKNISN